MWKKKKCNSLKILTVIGLPGPCVLVLLIAQRFQRARSGGGGICRPKSREFVVSSSVVGASAAVPATTVTAWSQWPRSSMDTDGDHHQQQRRRRRRLSKAEAMTTAAAATVLSAGVRRRAVLPARRSCSAVSEREMTVASAWQPSRPVHSLTKRSTRVYRYYDSWCCADFG